MLTQFTIHSIDKCSYIMRLDYSVANSPGSDSGKICLFHPIIKCLNAPKYFKYFKHVSLESVLQFVTATLGTRIRLLT